jgi:hypothetical protein
MRYLLLIQKDEAKYRALSDEARAELHKRYMASGMKMAEAGIMRSGAMLELTDTATTVRVRDGKRLITDGPFAETAEQIAGVMVIEVDHLDQAIDWAAKHPDAEWASIEIRPIVPFEPPPR